LDDGEVWGNAGWRRVRRGSWLLLSFRLFGLRLRIWTSC